MEAIEESFAINSPSNVTQRFVSKKLKEFKRTLHSDKVVCLPPRQRHLAKLITATQSIYYIQRSELHAVLMAPRNQSRPIRTITPSTSLILSRMRRGLIL